MVNLITLNSSPYNFNPSNTYPARVFLVHSGGHLNNTNVNNTNISVRPISFYNLHIQLRLNIIELGYKINHQLNAKTFNIDIIYLVYKINTMFIINQGISPKWQIRCLRITGIITVRLIVTLTCSMCIMMASSTGTT